MRRPGGNYTRPDGAHERRGRGDLEIAPDLQVDPARGERVGGVLDASPDGEVHDLLELEHRRRAVHAERAPDRSRP
jgi:hypothetical protein